MITNQILRNYVQWETSCSFRTDGQTKIMKQIIAFYNFLKPPKTGQLFQNIKIWRRNIFFLILTHTVYKMLTKQEPNTLQL